MKPTPLPGITQRPQWPAPSPAPRPNSPAPALVLRAQVLDTPEAQREAARLNGQLELSELVRTDKHP